MFRRHWMRRRTYRDCYFVSFALNNGNVFFGCGIRRVCFQYVHSTAAARGYNAGIIDYPQYIAAGFTLIKLLIHTHDLLTQN